jgi:iron complex transport system substrate-binding protein
MKKWSIIIIAIAILSGACSVLPGAALQGDPVEITDSTGNTVILNQLPDRVAIAGKATIMVQDAIYLFEDAEDKIIALENRNQSAFSFLPLIDPELNNKVIFEMNAGPEQIAAAKPELVIMKNFMAEQLGEPLQQLSIPVVYLNLETPEAFYQDVTTLGQVFGKPDRAEEIIAFYQDRVSIVEGLVGDLPAAGKPQVLVLQYSDKGGEVAFQVPPVSWLQTNLVDIAGGIPVWKDLEFSGGWSVVNLEQIAAWNPDQIYLIEYGGEASQIKAELMENPVWSNLRAVKDDQLYAFGYDFYSWDQPDTRWILGLQWLAIKIHPELSEEIDILEEVEAFYSVLYNLDSETISTDVVPLLSGDIP